MANVYVEARPKGRPEGTHIDDYVVEDHADHVLGTFKTQKEAIDWAKANGRHPVVARVRHLNDKKIPDHLAVGLRPIAWVGIQFAIPHALRSTKQVSGHGFSRAVKRTKKSFLSAEGWRAA